MTTLAVIAALLACMFLDAILIGRLARKYDVDLDDRSDGAVWMGVCMPFLAPLTLVILVTASFYQWAKKG